MSVIQSHRLSQAFLKQHESAEDAAIDHCSRCGTNCGRDYNICADCDQHLCDDCTRWPEPFLALDELCIHNREWEKECAEAQKEHIDCTQCGADCGEHRHSCDECEIDLCDKCWKKEKVNSNDLTACPFCSGENDVSDDESE